MRGQLRAVAEAGFHVELISSPGRLLDATADREGVVSHGVPMSRSIAPIRDVFALVRLTRLVRTLDVSISLAGTPKAGLLVNLACAFARVPRRIYLLRGLRLESETGMRRVLLWCTEWAAVHSAHEVIAVSPSLRDRTATLRLLGRRPIYVLRRGSSNGVDIEYFRGCAPTPGARNSLGLRADAYVFGYAGRITSHKGLRELYDAFARVRSVCGDVQLVICGHPETKPDVKILETADRGDEIRVLDHLADLRAFYAAIDCFVLPTYREGMPNVALEAAAAARPVITTRATGAIDAIIPGVTGLHVDVGDVDQLADAMIRLASDPELGRSMGRNGQEFVAKHYSRPDVQAALVDTLCRGQLAKPRRQAAARPR
jgi:glycosyltransferase involved in cell wall biosynthesis